MKIEIISNGYLLITEDEDSEGNKIERKRAFVFDADLMKKSVNENKDECEAMRDLIFVIQEELGFYNSKHNEYRLNMEVVKNEI